MSHVSPTWLAGLCWLALACQPSAVASKCPASSVDLAPTGRLRVAFGADNPVHATRDPVSGEFRGPAIDVGNQLAAALGVPMVPVAYRTVAEMVGSVGRGEWDVISIGINPERLKLLDFTAAYSQTEIGYLVRRDAPIRSFDEVDRPGVRIVVLAKGDADVLLSDSLRHATLLRTSAMADSIEMIRTGQADATAAIKTFLIPASSRVAGSRILDGRLMVQEMAFAVAKGCEGNARYLSSFIAKLKASGFIAQSVARAGVPGLAAAP